MTAVTEQEPAPAGAGSLHVAGRAAHFTRSWRGDYLLRLAMELATRHDGGGLVKARELAAATGIPRSYIAEILGSLVHAGLVVAKAGPHGGHRLARDPGAINLLDILDVEETSMTPPRCILRGSGCGTAGTCALHAAWLDAESAFRARLRSYTLRDLTGRGTVHV